MGMSSRLLLLLQLLRWEGIDGSHGFQVAILGARSYGFPVGQHVGINVNHGQSAGHHGHKANERSRSVLEYLYPMTIWSCRRCR